MSSKQLKKKNIKSPEKMKTEKLDNKIYTMEHYVGDPVELIKQIFSTLNTKTIKKLAPESLKECKIEEVQELCFNELLGISSKRLKSIINATKCPTDTESSDDDIQNVDEHISLEEISSDSDGNGKALNKKLDKTKNGTVNNPEAKTKGTNNKEMSVLELLELQARARAIRSQLALEPIAKIEVDSDDSDSELDVTTKSKTITNTEKRQENGNTNSHIRSVGQTSTSVVKIGEKRKDENKVIVNGTGTNNNSETIENRPKKIKLKRNFRKRSIDTENTNNNNNCNNESTSSAQINDKIQEKSPKPETERSPSPEVLTILPNYETLCISDSDDDNNNTTKETTTKTQVNNCENVVEKEDNNDKNKNNISKSINEQNTIEDFEDGEIIDNNLKELNKDDNDNKSEDNNKSEEKNDIDDEKSENNEIEIKLSDNSKIIETTKEIEDLNDSDHHNDDDDIISLGDDDLDYEMHDSIEEIEEKSSKIIPKIERKSPEKNDELIESADFIELHDSGDDNEPADNQGQSWNTRWLQSKKVTKIMAESKLVNRVRDNRKKTKKAQLEQQQLEQQQQQKQLLELANEKEDPKSISKAKFFLSNFEDGSVQQYKEIIDRDKNTK